MSKQQKDNRESKKPKAVSDGTKTQQKNPKRLDGTIAGLFGNSK